MTTPIFLKKEAIKYGWETMAKHFWFFAGMLLIVYGLAIGLSLLGQFLIETYLNENGLAEFIFNVLINVLGIILSIGLVKIALDINENKPVAYKMLFNQWSFFWKYLGGMIVYMLIVMAGFILLIVPGIIWSIKYQFTQYLILEGYGPIAAIKRSGRITQGHKFNIFLLGLLLALISMAGFLALGVGLFVAQPLVLMAMVYVYKKLQAALPESSSVLA